MLAKSSTVHIPFNTLSCISKKYNTAKTIVSVRQSLTFNIFITGRVAALPGIYPCRLVRQVHKTVGIINSTYQVE